MNFKFIKNFLLLQNYHAYTLYCAFVFLYLFIVILNIAHLKKIFTYLPIL